MQQWMSQVRKGVVELWLMAALDKGEMYGYELFQQLSGKVGYRISEGTIYPLLARLMREGWVNARTGSSPIGPERRYYRLNASGVARLKKMRSFWKAVERETDAVLR